MDHQDLEPLIIHGKHVNRTNTKSTQKVTRTQLNKNTNHGSTKKVNPDEELPKQNLVGKELGRKIQAARTAKGKKQNEIAKLLNISQNDYQKYENGSATRNGQMLNKLGRHLGIKLTGKGV
uniref:HTH cro/C1-type domain-containing protein n=1 Tax=Megaviridae environmental sample TaxID=1737588 RepID=A0A5J6VLB5_9VIRU|nr:MAG: hypothetical protein [Megaviridae environmental sample]